MLSGATFIGQIPKHDQPILWIETRAEILCRKAVALSPLP
jgi:hypothetical protein